MRNGDTSSSSDGPGLDVPEPGRAEQETCEATSECAKRATMAIIDFHTHFFPDNVAKAIWKWFDQYGWIIQHKIFADELIRRLKSIGVEKMVLLNYAHKPGMSRMLNQWTRQFAARYPAIIPFGTVHPQDEDRDQILDQCFDEFGFHGLKLHTHVLKIAADDPVFFPIYERVEAAGKILMLHAGDGPKVRLSKPDNSGVAGVKRVRVILKRFPNLKLVIPHLGADESDAFFGLMEEHENLWMDTTMTLAGYFEEQPSLGRIEKLSDRILYGSDAPNIPYPLDVEINNIRQMFSEEVQGKIFSGNAMKLLGLERSHYGEEPGGNSTQSTPSRPSRSTSRR
jgi:predicted TIM-barrel fold metal-dependent hydrolase